MTNVPHDWHTAFDDFSADLIRDTVGLLAERGPTLMSARLACPRMEHGDIEWMQVGSIAAYVTAIGGHLPLVADFDQASTTFIDYTEALTA